MSSTRMGRPKKPVEVPVIDWVAVSNLDQVIYNWFSLKGIVSRDE